MTLCKTCHERYHKGLIQLPKSIKRGASFKDATFMNIMKGTLIKFLGNIYANLEITYGYITKNKRIAQGLPKEHYIDARCISDNLGAVSDGTVYYYQKIRQHNRKIQREVPDKTGTRRKAQLPKIIFGYQLYDIVKYKDEYYYVAGRRTRGCFLLKNLNKETKVEISYKKIKLICHSNNFIVTQKKKVA